MRVTAQGRPAALGRKPLRVELAAALRHNPITRHKTSLDLSQVVVPGPQFEVCAEIHAAPLNKRELRSLGADNGLNWNGQASALFAYDDIDLRKEILFQHPPAIDHLSPHRNGPLRRADRRTDK